MKEKLNVLLVSSNLRSQFPRCFPNATACLSAYLKRDNYHVKMIHLHTKADLKRLPKNIEAHSPDVVGISAMTCESPLIPRISTLVKTWKNVPVLVGGIHAIIAPNEILNCQTVDGVCIGEGELAFHEYLEKYTQGRDVTDTPSFWFRGNNGVIKNPKRPFIEDLDTLPYPDRTQGDLQKVIDANNGVINILLGRGCNWTCRFCCNRDIKKANTGVYVRNKSVGHAINELEMLSKQFRFSNITIRDDNFPWDRQWALEFCEEYPKRMNTAFEVFARADCLDEETMDALKAAGCYSVFLGLDSGNDYIRNEVLHKRLATEDLLKVCRYMKSINLQPVISNIVGLPFETEQMHQDTIAINQEIYKDGVFFSPSFGATPKIWVFDPWPKTELYEICKEQGWINAEDRSHKVYRQSMLDMPQFTPKRINWNFRNFRYKVYKKNFPVRAWMFRIYDTRLSEEIMELIPLEFIGTLRRSILRIMNRAVAAYLDSRKKTPPSLPKSAA